jgi:hypothetical protein
MMSGPAGALYTFRSFLPDSSLINCNELKSNTRAEQTHRLARIAFFVAHIDGQYVVTVGSSDSDHIARQHSCWSRFHWAPLFLRCIPLSAGRFTFFVCWFFSSAFLSSVLCVESLLQIRLGLFAHCPCQQLSCSDPSMHAPFDSVEWIRHCCCCSDSFFSSSIINLIFNRFCYLCCVLLLQTLSRFSPLYFRVRPFSAIVIFLQFSVEHSLLFPCLHPLCNHSSRFSEDTTVVDGEQVGVPILHYSCTYRTDRMSRKLPWFPCPFSLISLTSTLRLRAFVLSRFVICISSLANLVKSSLYHVSTFCPATVCAMLLVCTVLWIPRSSSPLLFHACLPNSMKTGPGALGSAPSFKSLQSTMLTTCTVSALCEITILIPLPCRPPWPCMPSQFTL